MSPSPPVPGSDQRRLELIEAGGLGLDIVELRADRAYPNFRRAPGVVVLGVHRRGPPPIDGLEAFDILVSANPDAAAPWVGAKPETLDGLVEQLRTAVERQPLAAAVCGQVLRMSLTLSFDQALALESLSYSMLLASKGFRAWREATAVRRRDDAAEPRVRLERRSGRLEIRLDRAKARNAVDAQMRDALVEALEFARMDPDQAPVVLSGEGPAFCAGGDLDEFGTADDPGRAHAIRLLRSPVALVHRMRGRVTANLHGACIGAGIEIPAAAGRVAARPGAFFRLPEVSMGLIPGAGGTASVPRRIGRHRTCYMAISDADLDVRRALSWGLIDAVEPGP